MKGESSSERKGESSSENNSERKGESNSDRKDESDNESNSHTQGENEYRLKQKTIQSTQIATSTPTGQYSALQSIVH